jgi:Zn-dependent protease
VATLTWRVVLKGVTTAAAHEVGHWKAASKQGVQLDPPIFIPAGLGIIGSFGAITGIKGALKNRSQLLQIAAAGPLYGAAAAGIVTLIGLGLSAASVGPTVPVRQKCSLIRS